MGFSWPELVVVSGLSFVDGILAVTKPFSQTFFFFFLSSQWNFGYHGAFLTNFFLFSFFTMEFRLSRSLSHEFFLFFFTMEFRLSGSLSHELFLFSRWTSGYHEAFLMKFFFFHDGLSAIRKPFSRTFSFFTMEFRLSGSLSHELFLFSRWTFGYQEAFLRNFFFFHDGTLAITKPFS
jgi:hypothetical protein